MRVDPHPVVPEVGDHRLQRPGVAPTVTMQQKSPPRLYFPNNAALLAKLWTLATVVGGLLFGAVVATVGTRLVRKNFAGHADANANAAGFGPDAGGSPQHAYHVNPADANANATGFGPDVGGSPQHAYHVNPAAVLQTQSLQRSIDECTLGHYGQGAIGLRYRADKAVICDPRRQNSINTSSGVQSGGHRRRRASTSRGVVQAPAYPEVRPSKAGGSVHHPRTATLVFISAMIDAACRAWRAGAV